MIEINDLTYTVNNNRILYGINSFFREGEITGIIGESGCGKTALLKIISGMIKSYTGEIFFKKQPLKSIHPKDIKKQISSTINLSPNDIIDDTVFNFLLQSRKQHKKILNPFTDYDIEITEDYIKQFHLTGYRDKKVLSLPDGIMKCVFIAFPFIKRADALLLDDPTSSLDLQSISLLQKAVLRYVISGDRTIILTGNDLNFILQTADRILIMKEGKIGLETVPDKIDSEIIKKYFNIDVLTSRNVYNGKPIIHLLLGGAG
jgi:iron complex transport system ATP-binding protein